MKVLSIAIYATDQTPAICLDAQQDTSQFGYFSAGRYVLSRLAHLIYAGSSPQTSLSNRTASKSSWASSARPLPSATNQEREPLLRSKLSACRVWLEASLRTPPLVLTITSVSVSQPRSCVQQSGSRLSHRCHHCRPGVRFHPQPLTPACLARGLEELTFAFEPDTQPEWPSPFSTRS